MTDSDLPKVDRLVRLDAAVDAVTPSILAEAAAVYRDRGEVVYVLTLIDGVANEALDIVPLSALSSLPLKEEILGTARTLVNYKEEVCIIVKDISSGQPEYQSLYLLPFERSEGTLLK